MAFSGQHLVVIGVIFWTSASCTATMPQKIDAVLNYDATFVCDVTNVMKVSFTPFAAVLESGGIFAALTQRPAANGFLYTGGGQSLRAYGNEAIWTDSNGAAHQCQERIAKNQKSAAPSR